MTDEVAHRASFMHRRAHFVRPYGSVLNFHYLFKIKPIFASSENVPQFFIFHFSFFILHSFLFDIPQL